MYRQQQPDAQRLTERAHRRPPTGQAADGSSRKGAVLAGVGITYTNTDQTQRRRAARYLIRKAGTDQRRAELLETLGLTYDDATPEPNQAAFNDQPAGPVGEPRECPRCRIIRAADQFAPDRTDPLGRRYCCKRCDNEARAERRRNNKRGTAA